MIYFAMLLFHMNSKRYDLNVYIYVSDRNTHIPFYFKQIPSPNPLDGMIGLEYVQFR